MRPSTRPVDFLEAYKELSKPRKMCEVYYNLGRSFSHLSMSEPALKMFAECKDLVDDKLAQISTLIACESPGDQLHHRS